MRLIGLLGVALALSAAQSSLAQCACGECLGSGQADALRAYEIAVQEQWLQQRVVTPTVLRTLQVEIEVAEARVGALRDRLREYEPFTKNTVGGALTVTIGETELALLREELHLRNLRDALAAERSGRARRAQWAALRAQAAGAAVAAYYAGDPREPIVIARQR